LLKKAQAVVQKTSGKNVTSAVSIFFFFSAFFDGSHWWENHSQLKGTALKQKKE
jgi:hypothetical protein